MTLIFRDAKIPRSQWLAGVAVEHDAYVHSPKLAGAVRSEVWLNQKLLQRSAGQHMNAGA